MIHIIIADDHAMFRQGLINLLSGANDIDIVAQCANGMDAIAAIETQTPDIAVLDITMPLMDGLAVSRRIQAQKLPTRVIILSMHDDPAMRQRAEAAGVCSYVLKDDAFEKLLDAIRAAAACHDMPHAQLSVSSPDSHELTGREKQVLQLIARGGSNRTVAGELGISIKTVDVHRTNLMRKLNIHTTAELVRHALQMGFG